jgi:hypothetical protein
MEADHARKIILAVACHLHHGHAAEAVADRGHPAEIRLRHLSQLVKTAACPLSKQWPIGCIFLISASQAEGVFGRMPLP